MKRLSVCFTCLVSLIVLTALSAPPLYAGSLEPPPGPPASTMKNLDQVEPRIPIISVPFPITQSGSYYLTGNLQPPSGTFAAIHIQADDVTVDLMGYRLKGSGSISEIGVLIDAHSRVEVKNGVIQGFAGSGVNAQPGSTGCILTNLRIADGYLNGIVVFGKAHLVEGCVISGYYYGIYAEEGCIIRKCIIHGNKTGIAFDTGNCYVDGNMLFGNTDANLGACTGCTIGTNHMY